MISIYFFSLPLHENISWTAPDRLLFEYVMNQKQATKLIGLRNYVDRFKPIVVVVGFFWGCIDFQYGAGDSVLLVNENDYNMCNVWNPISSWINGPHAYELTIPTTLFFISGSAGSCRKGELVAFPVIAVAAWSMPILTGIMQYVTRPRTTYCSY